MPNSQQVTEAWDEFRQLALKHANARVQAQADLDNTSSKGGYTVTVDAPVKGIPRGGANDVRLAGEAIEHFKQFHTAARQKAETDLVQAKNDLGTARRGMRQMAK